MNETILAVLGLGFVLGLRHAMEPDHLVAVSTIVSRNNSIAHSSLAGTLWGLGHTASLFVCGGMVLALKLTISEDFMTWAEGGVAVMLVILGFNSLRRLARPAAHDHHHEFTIRKRSFLIGMVHGLAGSGALTVLVLATVPSIVGGLIYILLFGLGSIGGMLLLSSLISIPFVMSSRRYRVFNRGLQLVAGLMSIALGLFWRSL
jgi:ABC-type nickel/cobalt efflux system permease component RcnA